MIRKSFLIRTFLLAIALAAVLVVIVTTMRFSIDPGLIGSGRRQTFFEQFVIAGGPIVWFILLPMSLVTVYLAVKYSLIIRRKKLLPDGIGQKIVELTGQLGPGQMAAGIAARDDFVSKAVVRAIEQGRGDWFRMRNLLFESLQEQALGYVRKIEWINLIGNVSPMVGLFGTVFGMIKLFNAIVMAGGQPQPAQLAEGISVALVTTFWGLFIAIPALAIYGVFQNRIEALASDAVAEAENILPQIRLSLKKPTLDRKSKPKKLIRGLAGKSVPISSESSLFTR
jgi:biopolymer transport protein ExbB